MSRTTGVAVGFDGSAPALTAVDWAVAYARPRKLPLWLITATDAPVPGLAHTRCSLLDLRREAQEQAQQVVNRALARCRTAAPELDVTGTVSGEPPIPTLLRAARTSRLLVVGSRGLGPVEDIFLGSVSTSVSAHARCPVAVVRSARQAGPATPVVAGLDGSERDNATLATAFDEAARKNAPLIAVHAWSDVALMGAYGGLMGNWSIWEELKCTATELVETQVSGWITRYPSVRVESRVVRDQPATALLELGHTAGLIVVGSHGRGGFVGMLLGSVARRLVHRADCPVVVVRAPDHRAGQGHPTTTPRRPAPADRTPRAT